MARLHKEYVEFNGNIKLTSARKVDLLSSRKSVREKITKYFKEEKPDELQPVFIPQGSSEMNTTTNPIPETDQDGNTILKYDLDDGVHFFENEGEDNMQTIETWHNWVYNAVKDHTNMPPIRKVTCIRVIFSDGHHIDLPIYYNSGNREMGHRTKGWLSSDPEEFTNWFNDQATEDQQLRRIVRYLKAWKNYREVKNSNLKFPSGFALTILVTNHFSPDDFDDIALKETVKSIKESLNQPGGFKCLRPTTPKGEDLFADYSEIRKNDFLNALNGLYEACEKAGDEKNFKAASEHLRKQFGDRFPLGKDEDEETKSFRKANLIGVPLAKKPYGE